MTLVAPVAADGAALSEDNHSPAPRSRWLLIAAVAGAGFIAMYLVIALVRLRYPYELEWIEGGMVDHVARIRGGHSLYAAPSLGFTADIYTPLYFLLSAAVSVVTGLGFFPLRLVSVLASIALFGALAKLTMADTEDRVSGLLAAGLFAACFRIGGAWLDTARVDTLCLALLFWGMVVARQARTARNGVVAGLLISLAFLAKQVALFPAVAIVVFFLAARRGRAVTGSYALTALVGIGGSTLVANAISHGWYNFYVFELPARHEIASENYVDFFTHDLIRPLPVVLLLVVTAFLALRRRMDGLLFHAIVGGAVLFAAYSARLHTGGYDNVLLPIYAELAVLAAIGIHHLLRSDARRWIVTCAGVLVLAQFALLFYNPVDQLPTAADRRAGEAMMTGLRALPKPAYLPGHPWYLVEAGQQSSAQGAAIEDVFRGDHGGSGPALARELWDSVSSRHWAAIVVDSGTGFSYLPDNLCRYYEPVGTLDPSGATVLPLTGTKTGPKTVWEPRPDEGDDCHGIDFWTVGPNG
ncbi:MAG TPA: glycosyltransferase family 39 protein [Acidimicrobiales bacterium]|nr:glycosyltransferase family 39 protein [Acidimicrobiales bacterium]